MSNTSPACRLALVAHPGPGAEERVSAALAAADVASLIIAPAICGTPLDARGTKPLVDLAQSRNVAALIADDTYLARTLEADGAHLTWSEDIVARYREAREVLGSRSITGADAGRSRHTAMELGEANADYIAFGIPTHVGDRDTAVARRFDLVEWWAEIFAPPVVAFDVENVEDATLLARAGADFVAITLPRTLPPEKVADWLRPMLGALVQKK